MTGRFNYQKKAPRRRAIIYYAAALFFLAGMTSHYGVILCYGSDGHTSFEKASQQGCCASYKVCQSKKTPANLCFSKDMHPHAGCGGCLDIPVGYFGILTAGHFSVKGQQHILFTGSFTPSLHLDHPEERTVEPPYRRTIPLNTTQRMITIIVLLI